MGALALALALGLKVPALELVLQLDRALELVLLAQKLQTMMQCSQLHCDEKSGPNLTRRRSSRRSRSYLRQTDSRKRQSEIRLETMMGSSQRQRQK
jgi:hypothetical protein|tara:strand:+ start:308 stop:595 length:288 start_codon:yes stop_codon:yes gene_type:complete